MQEWQPRCWLTMCCWYTRRPEKPQQEQKTRPQIQWCLFCGGGHGTVEEAAMDTTATTTMVEEVVSASTEETEEVAEDTMDIATVRINPIDDTGVGHISSSQCHNQFLYHILLYPAPAGSSRIPTSTATMLPSKCWAVPTMANGATNSKNNDCDRLHQVQRASPR